MLFWLYLQFACYRNRDRGRDRDRDRERERDRDRNKPRGRLSRWSQDNPQEDRQDHNDPLLNRLRMLAGHENAGSVEKTDAQMNFGT